MCVHLVYSADALSGALDKPRTPLLYEGPVYRSIHWPLFGLMNRPSGTRFKSSSLQRSSLQIFLPGLFQIHVVRDQHFRAHLRRHGSVLHHILLAELQDTIVRPQSFQHINLRGDHIVSPHQKFCSLFVGEQEIPVFQSAGDLHIEHSLTGSADGILRKMRFHFRDTVECQRAATAKAGLDFTSPKSSSKPAPMG